ncbi:hypothetical protein BC628DRAFT_791157 [Trametes gibbosa]|nr:hypothetical protein BC628DRAFT_791157 [Trametes gibbosa]
MEVSTPPDVVRPESRITSTFPRADNRKLRRAELGREVASIESPPERWPDREEVGRLKTHEGSEEGSYRSARASCSEVKTVTARLPVTAPGPSSGVPSACQCAPPGSGADLHVSGICVRRTLCCEVEHTGGDLSDAPARPISPYPWEMLVKKKKDASDTINTVDVG